MFSSSQQTVAGRFIILLVITVLSVNIIPSQWLAEVMGKPSLVPVKIEGVPLITLTLLLMGFLLMYRSRLEKADLGWPRSTQALLGWFFLIIVILFSYNALHPDYEHLIGFYAKANESPMFYGALLGGLFYAALLLPFVFGLFAVFRLSFLSQFRWPLLLIIVLTFLSIFGLFLEVQYFSFVYKPTMMLVDALLRLFAHPAEISANYMHISLAEFSVNVGPACSGFRFATIFTILYGLVWYSFAQKGNARHARFLSMYIGGLVLFFFINAFRIALIVMVGKYNPEFAAVLFHNMIGAILFFVVFYAYIKKVKVLL